MSDGSKEMVIRVVYDDADAVRQANAYHQGERKRIKDTGAADQAQTDKDEKAYVRAVQRKLQAGKQLEAAIKKMAKGEQDDQEASEKSYVRAVQRKLKAEKQLEDAATKRGKGDQAAIDQSEKDYVKAIARKLKAEKQLEDAAAKKAKADHDATDASEKAYVRAVQRKLKAEKQLEDAEKAWNKQTLADIDKEEKAYVRAKYREAHALESLANEEERRQLGQQEAIMANVKALALYTAGMVGLHSASQVLDVMYQKWKNIRQAKIDANTGIVDSADKMRQLAALEGNAGLPSKTLTSQMDFRNKTLLKEDPALEFKLQSRASGYGAIQAGLTSEPEYKELEVTMGKMTQRLGIDPGAVGKFTGLLPYMDPKKNKTAAEMSSVAERMYETQKLGGFSNFGEYVKQAADSSVYVTKQMMTAQEQASLLSLFAIGGQGDVAGTRLEELAQAISTGVVRNRGIKVADEYKADYETSAVHMKKLGIDDDTPFYQAAKLVAGDMQEKMAAAHAQGKYFNPKTYAITHGFQNQHAQDTIAAMAAGLENSSLQTIEKTALAPLTPSTEDAQWKASMVDPANKRERHRLNAEMAAQGIAVEGGLGLYKKALWEGAYGETGGKAKYGEELDAIISRTPFDREEFINQNLSALDWEAQRMVLAEADKFKVQHRDPVRRSMKSGAAVGVDFLGYEELMKISDVTRNAGGQFVPGGDPAKLQEAIDRNTAALEMFTKKVGNAPPAAAGPAPLIAAPPMPAGAPRGG